MLALLTLSGPLAAETGGEPIPPPPPPPEEEEGERRDSEAAPFEPEIRITTRDGAIFEEYRYNGVLYRIKVTPRYGPPYYLIYDELGEVRRSDAEPKILVPQWVIKRF